MNTTILYFLFFAYEIVKPFMFPNLWHQIDDWGGVVSLGIRTHLARGSTLTSEVSSNILSA